MKHSIAAFLFLSSTTLSHAEGCLTGPGEITMNLPGLNWDEVTAKVERVFPTFRDVIFPSDKLAFLWIDPKDCQAEDLEARHHQIETILGRQVILMPSTLDYRVRPRGFGTPEIVKTRKLQEIFPSLWIRGSKIGENVEVILVSDEELSAPDLDDRLSRAAAIVGRPVELRSTESGANSR
jgi:hypothetical protein